MSLMSVVTSRGFPVEIKVESESDFNGTPDVSAPFAKVALTLRDSEVAHNDVTLILNYDQACRLANMLNDWRNEYVDG